MPLEGTRSRVRLWVGLTIATVFLAFTAVIVTIAMHTRPGQVQEVPDATLDKWGRFLIEVYAPSRLPLSEPCPSYVQAIADSLAELSASDPVDVYVGSREEINAISLPRRTIVIYQGLLEDVESENELTMILGHELGHLDSGHIGEAFRRRALLALAASGFGRVPVIGDILIHLGNLNDLHFSREAEIEADQIGLALLHEYYGHVGGATDFFERRIHDQSSRSLEFLSTHPYPQPRVEAMRSMARQKGWSDGDTVALSDACVE